MHISQAEFQQRAQRLIEHLEENDLSGVVLFDPHYILYYTGFAFIPTERPIGFVMNKRGKKGLFVPRLEAEHARAQAQIDRVVHYLEYPGNPHPMEQFKAMLAEFDVQTKLAADHDGYPWVFGYRGPSLSTLLDQPVRAICEAIEDQMAVKSAAEVQLLRESAKWGNLAHTLLQRYTQVGLTETQVSDRAGHEATRAMLDAVGPIYRAQSQWFSGAVAGYRGQIGRAASIPHALANNVTFQAGDVLVTGATAPVWGYHSELERTMFLGTPSDPKKYLFDHMLALQEVAFEAMGPGTPCANVDQAIHVYYEKHDLMPLWRHHTGHAIGLRYHEGPFLDDHDPTVMRPGMVFTVEPGLYSSELGGFRHSDTVLITDDGLEMLTFYPRDIESLTLPV